MSKYHAHKTIVDGITFDSKSEANRYMELTAMADAGIIKNLRRQVPYELIPAQYVNGKLKERQVVYLADFVYNQGRKTIVEDVKGYKTPEYIIKRKLMLKIHGIEIREVKK